MIGPRQDPREARARYFQVFRENHQQPNLVLFTLVFSQIFLPKLHKVKYANQDKDWGVWHFVGDLPLNSPEIMTASWSRMEETP